MAVTPRNRETTQGPWKKGQRSKVSLMQVFRSSAAEKDAQKAAAAPSADGSEVTRRSKVRREGVGEEVLRAHLRADLAALLHTTRLDSVIDLDDVPHVRASVLNYGFRDLSTIGLREIGNKDVVQSIRRSLMDHEPRLIPDSIQISVDRDSADNFHHLSFSISAELMSDPVDIPLDFTADVDLGAGKLRLGKLEMQK